MKKIGITGSIGSGKSTVTRIFAQLGVPVYDADSRAKELMNRSALLVNGITSLFGPEAYDSDGTLNRGHLSKLAFENKELLKDLNALVHPEVFRDFDEWCAAQTAPYIVKEAALMFESDSYRHLDEIITVTCPEELRIQRAVKRDGSSAEAVKARMKNQMTQEEKLSRSQYEIKNDEHNLLITQVLDLHSRFSG